MDFFDNHTKLFGAAFLLFLVLTVFVALVPAINNEKNNAPLPGFQPLSDDAVKGKALFVANGCVACHTQQVRNVDMDKMWGQRPSVAPDYAANERTDLWRNTATLMGTERTGPDLTSIGTRQPSKEWNLVHLFNPRIVVKESIMPAYPWLFEVKKEPSQEDVIVTVPERYVKEGGILVAKKEALQLVAYLLSLKQTELPGGAPPNGMVSTFLYKKETKEGSEETSANPGPDGSALYATHCQACHQPTGEGLKGAFPALKGSEIVVNDNPELMLNIIINGYDAREEFGVMPAIGKNAELKPDEIAAIMNHERTSWGNNARKLSGQEVSKLMDAIKQLPNQ
ncbi:cbb3-type cytochrome c oxidase subunit II [Dyadobacter pollutisoli]|uniref:Cbb3-type cytochrome c oxidase subunit II n=1 Tax=Dyadobacter pollutisoli TaxID=2910158 RepID=A0A9E8NE29_9BACT|nr:cbb3-type cytochrome c oxidase subunit II [Dyadobacter pollutisoli]WAC12459.1 cbb3-type cytochrome c oxidase subunit II [Dyadobacter pollutisoli]